MTARSSGRTIGYLCAIAWIWRSLHGPWMSDGRDRTKVVLDSHDSRKFTSGDTSQKVTFKEVIGKWNFPRGNKNVSDIGGTLRGKRGVDPDVCYIQTPLMTVTLLSQFTGFLYS